MTCSSIYFETSRTLDTLAHDSGNVDTLADSALPREGSSNSLPTPLHEEYPNSDGLPIRLKSDPSSPNPLIAPSMEFAITYPIDTAPISSQPNEIKLVGLVAQEPIKNRQPSGYSVPSPLDQGQQGEGWTIEPESSYNSSSHALRLLAESFNQLNEKRSSINALRLRLQESRSKLRRTRDSLQERENQLMQRIREVRHGDLLDHQDNLNQQQDKIQEARDAFCFAESNYDHLEDHLIYEEYDLNQLESKIYHEFLGFPDDGQDQQLLTRTQGSTAVSPDASVITVGPPEPRLSINNRLQARIREKDNVEEHVVNLNHEYQEVLREQQRHIEAGLDLSKELRAFLDGAPQRIWDLQSRLTLIENELNALRQIKEDHRAGLSGMDQFKDQAQSRASTDSNRSLHLSESVAEPSDPIFLGHEDKSSLMSMVEQDEASPVISTLSYINGWLLFALRRSILQVQRFRSTPEIQNLNLDQVSLSAHVLRAWPYDETSDWFLQAQDQSASFDPSLWTNTLRTRHNRAITESYVTYDQQPMQRMPELAHFRRSLSERDPR